MKKFLCLFTAAILLLSVFALTVSAEDEKPYSGRSSSSFSLKREPSVSSDTVAYISNKALVVIFGEYGDWYKVGCADSNELSHFGYVQKEVINVLYTASTDSEQAIVRISPDPFSTRIGTISTYTNFVCVGEEVETGWRYVIAMDETTGYEIEGYISDGNITVPEKAWYTGSEVFPEELELSEDPSLSYPIDHPPYQRTDYTQIWAWFAIIAVGIYAIITIFRVKNA